MAWEEGFHRFMEIHHPEIEKKINTDYEIKPETETLLKEAITEFKKQAANA